MFSAITATMMIAMTKMVRAAASIHSSFPTNVGLTHSLDSRVDRCATSLERRSGNGRQDVRAYATQVAELSPAELAQLVDFSERARTHDWSLRSALVRYAQPQPARVEAILDLTRRLEFAIGKHNKVLANHGDEVWNAIESGDEGDDTVHDVVALLRVAQQLDALGDVLAAWAVDRHGAQPEATVDSCIAGVAAQLDDLGVPHEERVRPPRGRG